MRKNLLKGVFAVVFALALAAPAAAQDNVAGLGGGESAAGVSTKFLTAANNYFATRYQCTDPTGTSGTIFAQIADCCIAGDIWRATIYKGTKAAFFQEHRQHRAVRGGRACVRTGRVLTRSADLHLSEEGLRAGLDG